MHCALKVGQKIRQEGRNAISSLFLFISILANDISSERS